MLFLAVLSASLVDWVTSPAIIIPPVETALPVTVYVIEQNFHARLVVPDSSNGLMQYAYGDWRYFALNEQNLRNGVSALFLPTQGTLGRRRYDNVAELQLSVEAAEGSTLLNFQVAGAEASQLLQSLGDRFHQNLDTQVYNPLTEMFLVQDDQDYRMLHNSNHELVTWLQDLKCQVKGFVLWADFEVQPSPLP
jgi:hypothetical protein